MKKLSLIVPMYNEEEMIPLFFEKINEVLDQITDYNKEIVCVNDGSKDRTLELLKEYRKSNRNIHIVSFSRNFGHEAAVAAGFKCAEGDVMIVMDADLQDPPEVILDLLKEYKKGYKVVNAKRVDRKSDSFLKRKTAEAYYKVIAKMSGKIKVPENVGNFRLMDREVVDIINALPEKTGFFGFSFRLPDSKPERLNSFVRNVRKAKRITTTNRCLLWPETASYPVRFLR